MLISFSEVFTNITPRGTQYVNIRLLCIDRPSNVESQNFLDPVLVSVIPPQMSTP